MNILEAPFIQEMVETTSNMYRLGWDERNGGNISLLLDSSDLKAYLDLNHSLRTLSLGIDIPELAGKLFLVTGTGKYFKNVAKDPETNLGIIRIQSNGKDADLLWGFKDGGRFTSELPAHLLSHRTRLSVDPKHRVILHCHPTHVLAMNHIHPLDDRSVTRTLWGMCTECIVVFPEGVSVLPWMVCGNETIGIATAEKMHDTRIVIWGLHGIYGAGRDLDEAFGLIETVEKAAQLYMLMVGHERLNFITDAQLKELCLAFNVKANPNYLD